MGYVNSGCAWFLGYISCIDVVVCMCYGTIVMHSVVVCFWQYVILMYCMLGVFGFA